MKGSGLGVSISGAPLPFLETSMFLVQDIISVCMPGVLHTPNPGIGASIRILYLERGQKGYDDQLLRTLC